MENKHLKSKIRDAINIVSDRSNLKYNNLIVLSANEIIECIEISSKLEIPIGLWLSGMRIYSKLIYILDNSKELMRLPISEEDFKEVSILAQYLKLPDTWKSGCTPNSIWLDKVKISIDPKRPSVLV